MSTRLKKCTGIILAGGENTRMPVLKAFIKINNRTIMERSLYTYRKLFTQSAIVTNQPEYYSRFSIPLLGDIYSIRGPMTGVFTALVNSADPWVFISACDMPFLNKNVIIYMASKRNDGEAVVPVYRGVPEPLHAFYSVRLAASMERALLDGRNSLKDFLHTKKVNYLSVRDLKTYDPEMKFLINLNSPQDLKNVIYS